MRYGNPSLKELVEKFKQEDIDELIVIPLFPQYSRSTTESVIDCLEKLSAQLPFSLAILESFHLHPSYLDFYSAALKKHLENFPDDHVLFSYHGLPERYLKKDARYLKECLETSRAIAKELSLKNWSVSFQSRFGPEKWLEPATEDALAEAARQKKGLVLLAPGFFADCLETLEEIDQAYREAYFAQGGVRWERLACLNDSKEARILLEALIRERKIIPSRDIPRKHS
jgi:ferrochelatase